MEARELKTVRDKLKLTQQELAKKLGVHWVTLCRWETGIHRIPLTAAIATKKILEEETTN